MPTRIQVTIRTTDNIPENFITNQLALTFEPADDTESGDIVTAVKTFFDTINSNILPSTVAQQNHLVKLYDLPGTAPNYPFYEESFDLISTPTGDPLPSEVALCLSFQGFRTAGFPQARRRGRIYLGPLEVGVNDDGRPLAADVTNILDAAENFYDDIAVLPTVGQWAVWSPTDGQAVTLVEAWVDDAFDTQRSRGLARTTRTIRSLV